MAWLAIVNFKCLFLFLGLEMHETMKDIKAAMSHGTEGPKVKKDKLKPDPII